ncbi:hypothetical protein K490DRAFT_62220 [Saccharata proteae CBS 121410]|uniref:Uncharacterized protein n=1 Tax=Saccharata proteae CBS 121410 TaxID=1314787 RepID=A0A9P4HZS2_9PEZI|nr:hypothetical protein K490DRAFT_62220 [Saccharata proteae CBS 121410]
MSAVVDAPYGGQYGRLPHRKPLPTQLQPLTQIVADEHRTGTHSRSRTSSSSVFPSMPPQQSYYNAYQPSMTQYGPTTRRTLSNATTSTSSTNTSAGNGITPMRSNSGLRRSSSGRSSNSQSSYVALMRKQKATVWCDRSQYEDPRIMAQQRAAKMRAAMEVVGGSQNSRTSTSSSGVASGVRSKIRHHGAPKASLYTPANLAGSGVPMRLSASEVDEGDNNSNDADSQRASHPYHQRSGSGRSSLGSGKRVSSYPTAAGPRYSTSSSPQETSPTGTSTSGMAEETPMQGDFAVRKNSQNSDYFGRARGTGLSGGSGSSGERENSFGGLGQIPHQEPRASVDSRKTSDDLKRRGSVDDRSTTMSGAVRLFVANPDNDSD